VTDTAITTALAADLVELQGELAELETVLSTALAEYATIRSASLGYAAQAKTLSVERIQLGNKMLYDSTLTEAEQASLQAEISAISVRISGLRASMVWNGRRDIDNAREDIEDKKYRIAQTQEDVAIADYNVTQAGLYVAAAGDNESIVRYSARGRRNLASHATHSVSSTGVSKTQVDYRFTARLEDYDLRENPSVKLTWRERTFKQYNRAEGEDYHNTSTFVTKTVTVSLSDGDTIVHTLWQSMSVPAPDYKTTIEGVAFVPNVSSGQSDTVGGVATKRGFYGYRPSSPPKIFKKESYTGGFAGCSELGLDSENYTGAREYVYTEPVDEWDFGGYYYEADGTDAWLEIQYGTAAWPANFQVTPTLGSSYSAGGIRNATVAGETMTARSYRQTIICGEGETDKTLAINLSKEFTTAELKSDIDTAINDWESDFIGSMYNVINSDLMDDAQHYAAKYLSEDETTYVNFKTRWKFKISGWDRPDGDNAASVTYNENTLNLETGTLVTVKKSTTVELQNGSSSGTNFTTLEASDGEVKWVSHFKAGVVGLNSTSILVETLEENPMATNDD
jgi:hypothetical protein